MFNPEKQPEKRAEVDEKAVTEKMKDLLRNIRQGEENDISELSAEDRATHQQDLETNHKKWQELSEQHPELAKKISEQFAIESGDKVKL